MSKQDIADLTLARRTLNMVNRRREKCVEERRNMASIRLYPLSLMLAALVKELGGK